MLIALISPGLLTASIAFLVFKSVDYSLFRAAKELLYVPLPFDARFRAKELIDVFGYRFGKGSSSLGVGLLFRLGSVPHVYSLVLGALVILSWGYFALSLGESVMVLKTEEAQSKNQVKTI